MKHMVRLAAVLSLGLLLSSVTSFAASKMERLNRGVVAVRTSSSQVYVGWRMLGTDPSSGLAFNVYRGTTKLNATPITGATNYVDATTSNSTYTVRPVVNGVEQAASESAAVWTTNYKDIPLSAPADTNGTGATYSPNDCSVGDVDGDGQYEIILKWDPSNSKDNSQSGLTGAVFLDAYTLGGTRLWRIDLGRNIRAGAHYTQFMVYDLNSDGKAEVVCKTAPGTRAGNGSYLSKGPAATDNDAADYRNSGGYILTGPEYLTVFNGQTGAEMATINYEPGRGNVGDWGDTYGNRVDRFLACVAYLDGTNPSLVMCRGYYTRAVLVAYDWNGTSLTKRWTFDSNVGGYSGYAGQGNHNLSVGDVDGDGRDEIVYGACCIDDNGAGKWTTGYGHGDALHLSDIVTTRAGLEVFGIHEGTSTPGCALLDANTGATIWKTANADIGRGVAADLTGSYSGMEVWTNGSDLRTNTNASAGAAPSSVNFLAWWDGDELRELLNSNTISKYAGSTLLTATDCSAINGTKSNPCLSADLLGDWREEVIFRTNDNTKLRIFTTTTTTTRRLYTLMHNRQYRISIAWQNVAYNQPPHTSYFLGSGMSTPPQPDIVVPGGGGGATVFQAENGAVSSGGVLNESTNAGYTGTGYANTANATGAYWEITVNVPTSGTYSLVFRHANGGTTSRPADLSINGTVVQTGIAFPSTGAWTTWAEVSVSRSLNAGNNTIRLTATTAGGCSNIDSVTLQ